MLRQFFVAIVIWICLFKPALTEAQTTMGQLVASMQPGMWAALATLNINPTLGATGASGFIIGYSEDMVWDPISRQAFFLGSDHDPSNPTAFCFVRYTESTNSWQIMPSASWFPGGTSHGYDHSAVNPATGDVYHRPYSQSHVYKYTASAGTWAELPNTPFGPA